MTDNELLLTISKQLETINGRLDKMDDTLNTLKFNQDHITEKLKGLEVTMNYNDYHISHDVKKLQEDVETLAEVLRINKMTPVS